MIRQFCGGAAHGVTLTCAGLLAYQSAVLAQCNPAVSVAFGCHTIALTVLLEDGCSRVFEEAGWQESNPRKIVSWTLAVAHAAFLSSALAHSICLSASLAAGFFFALKTISMIMAGALAMAHLVMICEVLFDPNYQPRSWSEIGNALAYAPRPLHS